jgi:hypothetical protein
VEDSPARKADTSSGSQNIPTCYRNLRFIIVFTESATAAPNEFGPHTPVSITNRTLLSYQTPILTLPFHLHRFKLLECATCACNIGDQTIDRLLYQCTLLQTQREILKENILKTGNWPASKKELIPTPRAFINSTDFERLLNSIHSSYVRNCVMYNHPRKLNLLAPEFYT